MSDQTEIRLLNSELSALRAENQKLKEQLTALGKVQDDLDARFKKLAKKLYDYAELFRELEPHLSE